MDVEIYALCFQPRLCNDFLFLCRVSEAVTEELMTEVMLGILRQITCDVVNTERQKFEEEKRRAEEER